MDQIIECVPNFSEGRNSFIINQIALSIKEKPGIQLLNIDQGKAANRTVITFAGAPWAVAEAAFSGIKKASELIDMRVHHGEHPRLGATDVCPLVPVSGISLEETVRYARQLARRVGEELSIPVYCYEAAAFDEKRKSLANCRSGEYEGLPKKLADPEWRPDYGPAVFNERSGAVTIGARDFLIAYNVNLDTPSTGEAKAIACEIRESGRACYDPDTGEVLTNENGIPVRVPGTLKKVRAIGWYIEEYGIAQVSMNLTDLTVTAIHTAFEEVRKSAGKRGLRVTGSELIGLIPLKSLLDAGRYFKMKEGSSPDVPDDQLIETAVGAMGLDKLAPFDPGKRVIEYLLEK